MTKIVIEAKEMLERDVKATGCGACVYVPKAWMGKHTIVILKEDE